MKKFLSLALAVVFAFCLCASAFAAGTHTVTIINGMDGSVAETFTVADGEDFVFSISCAAPADMGPAAKGEEGAGVTTTGGKIAYSNITLGGPNQYPTAETVTISGITKDIEVTVTPNPDEVGSEFPVITEGELAGGASGEASGDASGEASGDASDEPYPLFEEYKEYLLETLLQDPFWQGNEANLRAGLDAAETPDDESIQNFTGSGDVDQAPSGVEFPMTYDEWYAINGGAAVSVEDAFVEYIHEWLLNELENNSSMTIEQVEDEFMPLVEEFDFVTFPAEMLWSGMLNTGVPMTFEEFAAQYVPAGAGDGYTADEDGYKAYLKDWVAANPAVQANIDEFIAAIDAGAYADFPLEMCFTDQWFGFAALTLDQFVAAGGVAEIPAFDPNLVPDAEP